MNHTLTKQIPQSRKRQIAHCKQIVLIFGIFLSFCKLQLQKYGTRWFCRLSIILRQTVYGMARGEEQERGGKRKGKSRVRVRGSEQPLAFRGREDKCSGRLPWQPTFEGNACAAAKTRSIPKRNFFLFTLLHCESCTKRESCCETGLVRRERKEEGNEDKLRPFPQAWISRLGL